MYCHACWNADGVGKMETGRKGGDSRKFIGRGLLRLGS